MNNHIIALGEDQSVLVFERRSERLAETEQARCERCAGRSWGEQKRSATAWSLLLNKVLNASKTGALLCACEAHVHFLL